MIRIAACILLGLASTAPVRASEAPTGTIVGRVVDRSTRAGLPFSNVVLLGTVLGTNAHDWGRFAILRVPPGEYQVKATFVAYQPAVETVTVAEGETTTVVFALARSTPHLHANPRSSVVIRPCDPARMPLPASVDSLMRARTLRACTVLGLEYPYQLLSWHLREDGCVGSTLRDGRGEEFQFAHDGRMRVVALDAMPEPPEPRCLYLGAPNIEEALRLPVGCKQERALLDVLHVWADEQIAPARRDSLYDLMNDATKPELHDGATRGLGRSQRIALALTGILRDLEKQRADWMKTRPVIDLESR